MNVLLDLLQLALELAAFGALVVVVAYIGGSLYLAMIAGDE